MANSPVIFFGSSRSGKTSLISSLSAPRYHNQYIPTIGIDIYSLETIQQEPNQKPKTIKIAIMEIAGDYLQNTFSDKFLLKIWNPGQVAVSDRVAVYCVDMDEPFTEVRLEQIKNHIAQFRAIKPQGTLIFAGTKTDLLIGDKLNDYVESKRRLNLLQRYDETRKSKVCLVSATHGIEGTRELLNLLLAEGIGEVDEVSLIFKKALTSIPERSELYKAIKKLQDLTSELPPEKNLAIAEYTNTLVLKLQSNLTTKNGANESKFLEEEIIKKYLASCKTVLGDSERAFQETWKQIITIVAVVCITIITAMLLSFIIGLSVSWWLDVNQFLGGIVSEAMNTSKGMTLLSTALGGG